MRPLTSTRVPATSAAAGRRRTAPFRSWSASPAGASGTARPPCWAGWPSWPSPSSSATSFGAPSVQQYDPGQAGQAEQMLHQLHVVSPPAESVLIQAPGRPRPARVRPRPGWRGWPGRCACRGRGGGPGRPPAAPVLSAASAGRPWSPSRWAAPNARGRLDRRRPTRPRWPGSRPPPGLTVREAGAPAPTGSPTPCSTTTTPRRGHLDPADAGPADRGVRRADRGGHPGAAGRHGGVGGDLAAGHPGPLAPGQLRARRRSSWSSAWPSASTTRCSTCAASARSGPPGTRAARPCGSPPATSGRAIVISGVTVMISLAGLFLSGVNIFTGISAGTIMVVGVTVLGSLTFLPALLSWLGPWADQGGLPWLGRCRKDGAWSSRAWAGLARRVVKHPVAWGGVGVVVAARPRRPGPRHAARLARRRPARQPADRPDADPDRPRLPRLARARSGRGDRRGPARPGRPA